MYDIIKTEVDSDSGAITAQLGDCTTNEVISEEATVLAPINYRARPPNASNNRACQALIKPDYSEDSILASRDLRVWENADDIGEGETQIFAPGSNADSQGLIHLKDAEIIIRTKEGNSSSGSEIKLSINSNGTIVIENSSYGTITMDTSKVEIEQQSGNKMTMDASGITLQHNALINLNAPMVNIGNGAAQGVIYQVSGGTGPNNPAVGVPSTTIKVSV